MHDVDNWLPPLRAGRQPAGRALLDWLDDPQAPRLCQVIGGAGTGKSHLISWLATACTSPGAPAARRPGVALSMAGLSLDAAVWLLALQLGIAARTPGELVAELGADDRPRLLLLWDLNRAAEAARIPGELLDPLLALPNVRAVVEGPVVTAVHSPAVLDLDQPHWTDPVRFARWYQRFASDSPFEVAAVYPNPRVAQFAARVPAGADVSAGVAGAWWSVMPDVLRTAVRVVAMAPRPLAFHEWAVLADPEIARQAADMMPPDSATGDTWWIPAGTFREAVGDLESDHASVIAALTAALPRRADGGTDLSAVDPDLLGLLLQHSAQAGQTALLEQPDLLAHAAPRAVTASFAAVPDARWAACWRAAGPALIDESEPGTRAAVLRVHLLARDESAVRTLSAIGKPRWQADWVYRRPTDATRLAMAALGQGPYVGWLLTADIDGAVRLVDAAGGRLADQPWPSVPRQSRSLACLADGTIAALDSSGALRVLAGPGLSGLGGRELSTLSTLRAVGDPSGSVHWLAGGSETLHDGPVTALDGVMLAAERTPLLLSGGLDGKVRAWKPGFPPLPDPLAERPVPVASVALAERSGTGLLTAVAWADGLVQLHRLGDASGPLELRLGAPVRTVLADGTDRVVVVTADEMVGLSLR